MSYDPADPNIFFVFVPFSSWSTGRVSHKKVVIKMIEDFPQLGDIPDWMNELVEYIAHTFDPSEVSGTEVCRIHSTEVVRYYLEKHHANNLLADLQEEVRNVT